MVGLTQERRQHVPGGHRAPQKRSRAEQRCQKEAKRLWASVLLLAVWPLARNTLSITRCTAATWSRMKWQRQAHWQAQGWNAVITPERRAPIILTIAAFTFTIIVCSINITTFMNGQSSKKAFITLTCDLPPPGAGRANGVSAGFRRLVSGQVVLARFSLKRAQSPFWVKKSV